MKKDTIAVYMFGKKLDAFAKKNKVTLSVAIIVLVIAGFVAAQSVANQQNSLVATEITDYSFNELSDNDTDGDGVADWRELLIGTNPLAIDTNEDGLDDGALYRTINTIYGTREVAALREEFPDATDEEILDLIRASRSEDENLSLSEQTGRELYVAGTMLNNLGKLTPELEEQLTDDFIERNIFAYPYPLRIITEFSIDPSFSAGSEVVYIDNVMETINVSYLEPEPLNMLENSLQEENENMVKKGLEVNVNRLEGIVQALDSTTVPTRYAEEHMELTNSFVRLLTDIRQIRDFYDDPLLGYTAMLRYTPNLLNHTETVEVVGGIFTRDLQERLASLQE